MSLTSYTLKCIQRAAVSNNFLITSLQTVKIPYYKKKERNLSITDRATLQCFTDYMSQRIILRDEFRQRLHSPEVLHTLKVPSYYRPAKKKLQDEYLDNLVECVGEKKADNLHCLLGTVEYNWLRELDELDKSDDLGTRKHTCCPNLIRKDKLDDAENFIAFVRDNEFDVPQESDLV